jgi:hypothetical protein
MQKVRNITRRSNGSGRRPFQLEQQHPLVSHPARSTEDGFDRGVDRLDHAEADPMIAVGGNSLDVLEQELAQSVHLRKALPPQCINPAVQEIQDARPRLVRPEPIELLPQHVGFEQAPIRGKECLQFGAFRPAYGFPPPQQEPPFAASMLPHHGTGAEELLPPHVIECVAGVLADVKLILW